VVTAANKGRGESYRHRMPRFVASIAVRRPLAASLQVR
jgi:hypothetical protein